MEKIIIGLHWGLKTGYYVLVGTLITTILLVLITLITNDHCWLRKIYDKIIK